MSAFFLRDGRCWARVHRRGACIAQADLRGGGTMEDVHVFLTQWVMLGTCPWDDGLYPGIAQANLRGGGTMDDVRVFHARWAMLGVHPWDDGRGACIAQAEGWWNDGRCWAHVPGTMDDG